MKKQFLYWTLPILLLVVGCKTADNNESKSLPKVAIAGLAIESSTFSPAQTQVDAFHARRGEEVFTYYPFMHSDSLNRKRASWFLRRWLLPRGTRRAFVTSAE